MRMEHILLTDIVPNPWRDMDLYPLDDDHVRELRQSIGDHGFFGGVKGRRRADGKVEIGCGHARIEAARLDPPLATVPVFIEDIDDDAMLRLMTDENATQAGSSPGAVINEVASVTRRLVDGLLAGTIVPSNIAKAFESESSIERTRSKLRMQFTEPDKADIHLALGHGVIGRYLGQGDPQSGQRAANAKFARPLRRLSNPAAMTEWSMKRFVSTRPATDAKPSKSRAAAKTKPVKRRKPVLDDRTANVFPNEHQFHAFREAVTTEGAQKVIPVEKQLDLAKSIVSQASHGKKQVGAPYIKTMVHAHVEQGMKAQRKINKEEQEAYLREQREANIDTVLHSADASLRSLLSALAKMADLADEFPGHPKIGGFSARLDTLATAIQRFSEKLKRPG